MSYARWEARADDVPGERITRSVATGLSDLPENERADVIEERKAALDRLRAAAKAASDEETTETLWALVPRIGKGEDAPGWDRVVAARTFNDFLALAMEAERDGPSEGADSQLTPSSLRTVAASIEEYLKFKKDFAANTYKDSESVLRRAVEAPDPKGELETFGARRLVSVGRSDVQPVIDSLPTRGSVRQSTRDDYRKHLKAWWNWELAKEEERAEDQNRKPHFTSNPFVRDKSRYSQPRQGRHQTVAEVQHGRRFYPHEADALLDAADVRARTAFLTCHRLGLRPGELIHLRWVKDVRPLDDADGYEVEIQGGRGRDPRCNCAPCNTEEGWAPKTGPRAYHLQRSHDELGWITPLLDALDNWVVMLDPTPGDFLFPSPDDNTRAWTNQSLNRRLHRLADRLRESGELPDFHTGRDSERGLTMHSWRHTCGSRLLELGVPLPLAAEWIGDDLETFKEVYGKPRVEQVAKATLAGYGEGESR